MKLVETLTDVLNDKRYLELTETLRGYYPKNQILLNNDFLSDLYGWINNSGVKNISFEKLNSGIGGIAHYDKLILNLPTPPYDNFCHILYVLLHETSHYYQFKKYGYELEYEIFKTQNVGEVASKILNVERIADRLAIQKFKTLSKTHNLKCPIPTSFYSRIDVKNPQYISYITNTINQIKEKNITNNKDLVDAIYNSIKL